MPLEDDRRPPDPSEPLYPIPLPEELAEFLRHQGPYACVTQATEFGTAYVIKAPAMDILSVRGRVPIHVQHTLYEHRNAPVIRTLLSVYDQPQAPLRLESFVNVADEQQRADFATLIEQAQLMLFFYDEELRHRLNKVVPSDPDERLRLMLVQADALRAAIPPWRYDFDRAKAAILKDTSL